MPLALAARSCFVRYPISSQFRTIPCDGSIGSSVLLTGGSCVGGTAMVGGPRWTVDTVDGGHGGRVGGLGLGGWHDSKMAIGSNFHVKITKSQIARDHKSQIADHKIFVIGNL
eukprot:scaffold91461_cov90-Cyclotella_meneghiniana.AAC.1